MSRKKLPIGVQTFARIREDDCYYVDKTGIALQLIEMVKQLSPVIRADGYHILADATGVPDLYAHIGPTLRRLIPWAKREPSALTGRARALVTAWVLIVVPVLLSMAVSAVLLLPRLATTAWENGASKSHAELAPFVNFHNLPASVTSGPDGGLDTANQLLSSQALMISTNEIFMGAAIVFVACAFLAWILPKPQGPVDMSQVH